MITALPVGAFIITALPVGTFIIAASPVIAFMIAALFTMGDVFPYTLVRV